MSYTYMRLTPDGGEEMTHIFHRVAASLTASDRCDEKSSWKHWHKAIAEACMIKALPYEGGGSWRYVPDTVELKKGKVIFTATFSCMRDQWADSWTEFYFVVTITPSLLYKSGFDVEYKLHTGYPCTREERRYRMENDDWIGECLLPRLDEAYVGATWIRDLIAEITG